MTHSAHATNIDYHKWNIIKIDAFSPCERSIFLRFHKKGITKYYERHTIQSNTPVRPIVVVALLLEAALTRQRLFLCYSGS